MRLIKLLLLSVFFFGILIFLLSLLLPSRAVVERSGVIDAPIATVYARLNDLKGWPAWNPWMAGQEISYDTERTAAWTVVNGEKRIPAKLMITSSIPAEGVLYDMNFEGMKGVKGTFNYKPSVDGKGTVILWRMETQLGYTPWWKLRGFLADRVSGPQLEDGLTKLKSICEGDNK